MTKRWPKGLILLAYFALLSTLWWSTILRLGGLSLQATITWKGSENTTTQVFWRSKNREYGEDKSFRTHLNTGQNVVTYPLPIEPPTDFLRLDPCDAKGEFSISEIKLFYFGLPIKKWAGKNLREWSPDIDVVPVATLDDRIEYRATGFDPQLYSQAVNFTPLLLLRTILVALLAFLTEATLLYLAPPVTTRASSLQKNKPGGKRFENMLVLTVSSIFGIAVIWGVLHYVLLTETLNDHGGYKSYLVGTEGQVFSEYNGGLKVVINPFTSVRLFPNQKTDKITINNFGYRGQWEENKKPKVVILGGSVAFGYGLNNDDETISAQFNLANNKYQFINAGVPGWLSGQELAEMTHYADYLNPRAYISLSGWNDYFSWIVAPQLEFAWSPLNEGFGYNPVFFKEIQEHMRVSHAAAFEKAGHLNLSKIGKEQTMKQVYFKNILRMNQYATGTGARFLVAFQPQLGIKKTFTESEKNKWEYFKNLLGSTKDTEFNRGYAQFLKEAEEFCKKNGISYINLNEDPDLISATDSRFVDYIHLNKLGFATVIKPLNIKLRTMGL